MTHDAADVDADRSVWATAMQELAVAGDRIAAQLSERGEPQRTVDAYLALLGATMDTYLNQLCAEPDFPTFVPTCGFFQHTGSPNPDTVYRRAAIDGRGSYRITGERGNAWQATIMPFAAPSEAGMRSWPPFDLSDVSGPDGRFDVVLGATRPADRDRDWWPLDPEMASLWLRTVSDDWGNETEPRIAIARLDGPSSRPRREAAPIARQIGYLGTIVERTIGYGIRHTDELMDRGVVNRLELVDYGASGAMPLQWYHEGVFDLADDEGLLIQAELTEGCDYFSCSLTDRMFVTLDWVHAQTSLNRHQATVDGDGRLRFVVAGRDPGIRNWMDTTGYPSGVVQCRWIGSEVPPEVDVQVVQLAALAAIMPAGTAEVSVAEREHELDARRRGAQLRSLW